MLDSATTHREAFDGLMFIVLLSSRTLNSLLRARSWAHGEKNFEWQNSCLSPRTREQGVARLWCVEVFILGTWDEPSQGQEVRW